MNDSPSSTTRLRSTQGTSSRVMVLVVGNHDPGSFLSVLLSHLCFHWCSYSSHCCCEIVGRTHIQQSVTEAILRDDCVVSTTCSQTLKTLEILLINRFRPLKTHHIYKCFQGSLQERFWRVVIQAQNCFVNSSGEMNFTLCLCALTILEELPCGSAIM